MTAYIAISQQQDCNAKKCVDEYGKCKPNGATTGSSVTFSERQLRCFYTNANSLIGKFDEF